MTTIKDRLRTRRITGMFGNNDPNHWGIELNEGVDPLCIEAADKIELLERENARLKADLAKARSKALEEAAMRMHTLAEAWGTNTPFTKEKHDSFSFAGEQILALRKKP